MRFSSRKSKWELILLVFMLLLFLYTVYLCLFVYHEIWSMVLILGLITACQGFFFYFRSEYEMTEQALVLHEKKPLKDKEILYEDIAEYRIVPRRLFGGDKPGLPKDIFIGYYKNDRKRSVILSPKDPEGFDAEFMKRCPGFKIG